MFPNGSGWKKSVSSSYGSSAGVCFTVMLHYMPVQAGRFVFYVELQIVRTVGKLLLLWLVGRWHCFDTYFRQGVTL